MNSKKETGFSLVETIIALLILLIGVMSALSALSFAILSEQDSEKRSQAKQIARSSMETIFSIRDLLSFDTADGTSDFNWETIQIKTSTNKGIFVDGWNPIREEPGADGIFGTADDICSSNPCVVGSTTNNSAIVKNYERKIEIYDIVENGDVKKRRITVRVRYFVGTLQREEAESTILANLPVK